MGAESAEQAANDVSGRPSVLARPREGAIGIVGAAMGMWLPRLT